MPSSRTSRRHCVAPSSRFDALEPRRLLTAAYQVLDLGGGAAHTASAYGLSNSGAVAMAYDGHAAYYQAGHVHDLGFPGYATDINDNGVVCGVDDRLGYDRPFVYANDHETVLSLSGRRHGQANAINASGEVVGAFTDPATYAETGFTAAPGGAAVALDLHGPAFTRVQATGVNDAGQIVGNASNDGTPGVPFIFTGNLFHALPLLSARDAHPRAFVHHGLTNTGTVALDGSSSEFDADPEFYYDHLYTVASNGSGAPSDKGRLDAIANVDANDVNAAGQIAGTASVYGFDGIPPRKAVPADSEPSHAVIYDGHSVKDLNTLIDPGPDGILLTVAAAINDSGQIACSGSYGDQSAYLLTPVHAATVSISGRVFNDTNANGRLDPGERGSGVRTVFLDANRNGRLDPRETAVRSDSSGVYRFADVSAGTYYVTRVFPSGYKLSNNAAGYLTITVSAGQAKTGVNLGSRTV